MLTIFSTPKPFHGHIGIIQRNAIKSWKLIHPDVEIILFGDDEGASEVCQELGIRHEADVRRNEHGTKFLNYIFDRAQSVARHQYLCYANCDIMFASDLWRAFERVKSWNIPFLMAGQRWDVELTEPWNFERSDWESRLVELIGHSGTQRPEDWIDYFLFSRGLYTSIPPLVIGRVHWDQWLIWKARSVKAAVVNASSVVRAVHQNHDYSYHPEGAQGVWSDEQSIRNREVAGGQRHLYTLQDATYTLTCEGADYNWFHRLPPLKRAIRPVWAPTWFRFLGFTRPIRRKLGLRKGFIANASKRRADRS
jgi:hypothetical protein